MRVAIVGAFCTGKTTLVNDLSGAVANSFTVSDECRPILDRLGNVDWSMEEIRSYLIVRQLYVEARGFADGQLIVIDGGIINNLAHDVIHLKHSASRERIIHSLGHTRYDLVLWCDPQGVQLVDDGQRNTNESVRWDLHYEVGATCNRLGYEPRLIQGDRLQRLSTALVEVGKLGDVT